MALRPRAIAVLADAMRRASASPALGTDGALEAFVMAESYRAWFRAGRDADLAPAALVAFQRATALRLFGRTADVRRARVVVGTPSAPVDAALRPPRPCRAAALTRQPDTSAASFSVVGGHWTGCSARDAGLAEAQLSSALRWFGARDQVEVAALAREKQLAGACGDARRVAAAPAAAPV